MHRSQLRRRDVHYPCQFLGPRKIDRRHHRIVAGVGGKPRGALTCRASHREIAAMNNTRDDVETHYTRSELGETILAALAHTGKDIDRLTTERSRAGR